MRVGLCVVLLLFADLASSQTKLKQPSCSVSGIVLRASDNEPLARAKVKIEVFDSEDDRSASDRERQRETATGPDGRFEFNNLACGRYSLVAARTGFLGRYYGQRGSNAPGAPLTLTAGRNLAPITLRLAAASAITGRVVDADGEPVSDLPVGALPGIWRRGKIASLPVQTGTTNDLGEYRLYDLPAGRYYVRAGGRRSNGGFSIGMYFMEPQAMPAKARKLLNVPTYYPGVTELEQATAVDLKAGDELRIDLEMQRAPAVAIRGRIVGGGRTNTVFAIARGMEYPKMEQSTDDGSFEFADLTPGQYVLAAISGTDFVGEEEGFSLKRGVQSVTLGTEDLEGVTLVLENRGRITLTGKISAKGGSFDPRKAAVVVAAPDETLELDAGNYFGLSQPQFARPKPDGTFVIKNLSPGKYRVALNAWDHSMRDWYTESIRLGTVDVMSAGLRITEANPDKTLEITLNNAAARVTGIVTDAEGHPLTGISVMAVPTAGLRKEFELYGSGTTDQDGRFVIRRLRPGEYTLFAFDGALDEDYRDDEFLAKYESQGKRVQLSEKQELSVPLVAIPLPDSQ
jgi:hypothetical protein